MDYQAGLRSYAMTIAFWKEHLHDVVHPSTDLLSSTTTSHLLSYLLQLYSLCFDHKPTCSLEPRVKALICERPPKRWENLFRNHVYAHSESTEFHASDMSGAG